MNIKFNYSFKNKDNLIGTFEIIVIILASFATAYIIDQAVRVNNIKPQDEIKAINKLSGQLSFKDKIAYQLLPLMGRLLFGSKGLVSAQTSSTASVVQTCVKAKDGSVCQEFYASECNDKCTQSCIPTSSSSVSNCKIGTCYDAKEGICQVRAPKQLCQDQGGTWFDKEFGDIAQCKPGCCVMGGQTFLSTIKQCQRKYDVFGFDKSKMDFEQDVNNELSCWFLSQTQTEGACVTTNADGEKTCTFTTGQQCRQLTSAVFSPGFLCSNTVLDSGCEKEKTTGCVENKLEIYWFDSCGNRENIYEGSKPDDKNSAWNNGMVKSKAQSCQLPSPTTNSFTSLQKTCGNCDYLLGTACGLKTSKEALSDTQQNVVCKPLTCVDENGNKRENGETWCAVQGAIGVETGSGLSKDKKQLTRSVDTVGSVYFKKTCLDGEVITENCGDYRNRVCVEAKATKASGGTFSSAACRINRWQECLNYNKPVSDAKKKADKATAEADRDDNCNQNSDCFLKEVNVADQFKFKLCAPKYPAGFDLTTQAGKDSAKAICSFANQDCTVIHTVSPLFGDNWINKDCLTTKFAEQMNDLCTSLGDCGAKVNYEGDYSENIRVYKDKKLLTNQLNSAYIAAITKYKDIIPGKLAYPGNISEFANYLGLYGSASSAKGIDPMTSMMLGAAGFGGAMLVSMTGIGASTIIWSTTTVGYSSTAIASTLGGAISGGFVGMGIAVAVVALLLQFTGAGKTMPAEAQYALMGAAFVGGAMAGIGASMAGGGISGLSSALMSGFAAAAGALAIIGLAIVVIVIALIVVEAVGGKTEKIHMKFQCQPWQQKIGINNCAKCGQDGDTLPCTKSGCLSLGTLCQYVNENTGSPMCVKVDINDPSPPVIQPLAGALQPGYQYTAVGAQGFKVSSGSSDGCIGTYTPVTFGIRTANKPSQCMISMTKNTAYDNMEMQFGMDNLVDYNHTMMINMPSLASLGVSGIDPNQRQDYTLYVKCKGVDNVVNPIDYLIRFCVKPGADVSEPVITGHDPPLEYLPYGATDVETSVFVNEPSTCKWSLQDQKYDNMENTMDCDNDVADMNLFGWACNATLPITQDVNNFYVRCKDQPWLAGTPNESLRNVNTRSENIVYKKTTQQLQVVNVQPSGGEIKAAVQPLTVTLTADTIGGYDGNAACKYSFNNGASFVDFGDTLLSHHTQEFNKMMSGSYNVKIQCTDQVGNVAMNQTQFNVELDTTAPTVTRVYDNSGTFVVVTNEEGECAYSNIGCSFDYDSGTKMSGLSIVHSTNFDSSKTYYIKCKDSFGNGGTGLCQITARGAIIQ